MRVPGAQTLQGKAANAPRVLIVRVGAMGDVIHALPAVAWLRAMLPGAHLGWAIEPRWAPLLCSESAVEHDAVRMPLVDAVHRVEAKQWNRQPLSRATARSILALRRELRESRYDIAIDLQGTVRSSVIARLSGAPVVAGSATPREGVARALYGTAAAVTATHVTDQALQLIASALHVAGGVLPQPAGAFHAANGAVLQEAVGAAALLPQSAEAELWWQKQQLLLCGDRAPVLLAVTAGWGAKEWPTARFADLAAWLAAQGYAVFLNTTPDAIDPATAEVLRTAQRILGSAVQREDAANVGAVHPLQATLPQLIAATRDMRCVVAGDTGPLHLAAALGVPTVGIFGPTAPERTGPRQSRSINVRHPSSVTDHRRHAETEPGLERLAVETVQNAIRRVLEA